MNRRTAGEMLVRRQLGTLRSLAKEYRLTIDVKLVKSCLNCADSLTRVQHRWMDLHRQDAPTVIRQLENVFLKQGPPMEILTNNDTAFTSKDFGEFVRNWDVHLRLQCAYTPSGNGIVE